MHFPGGVHISETLISQKCTSTTSRSRNLVGSLKGGSRLSQVKSSDQVLRFGKAQRCVRILTHVVLDGKLAMNPRRVELSARPLADQAWPRRAAARAGPAAYARAAARRGCSGGIDVGIGAGSRTGAECLRPGILFTCHWPKSVFSFFLEPACQKPS